MSFLWRARSQPPYRAAADERVPPAYAVAFIVALSLVAWVLIILAAVAVWRAM